MIISILGLCWPGPLHWSQPCHGKEACIAQRGYEPLRQGHPRWMGYSEESWQNVVHWRRKWKPTPVFLPWEPNEQYEKAKRYDTGKWGPSSEDVQYVPGEEPRTINNSSRKNEAAGPKQKQFLIMDVSGGESKVWCCKEQYCIGTWNVRSMNQGKLDVKQEIARVNIDILGISEVKWTGMGEFNSDGHYIYYLGKESLRRNGVALIINKRVHNAVLGHSLKNDRMNSLLSRQIIQHDSNTSLCSKHWTFAGHGESKGLPEKYLFLFHWLC